MSIFTSDSPLLSGSVTNATTMTINLTAYTSYKVLKIYFYGIVPLTASANLQMLVSANGSTYDNSSGNYLYFQTYNNSATTANAGASYTASASSIALIGAAPTTAGVQSTGQLTIMNPGGSSFNPAYDINFNLTSGAYLHVTAFRLASQQTQGIQLLFSTGNITGSYVVVGYFGP